MPKTTGFSRVTPGLAIGRERGGRGLSQEDFAERANVHRTYVSPIELGKVNIGIEVAHALARALGMKLMAIKWSDFDGGVLRISRRICEGEIDEPKTKSSARDLPIPAMLLARLRALGSDEWIFRATNGSPVNPGNALKRYVRPAVRELNLSIGGWHDFRHTLATSLRRRGYSSRVVAEIVGHSSVRTTEQIYVHADDADFRSALGEISDELFRNVPKSAAVN